MVTLVVGGYTAEMNGEADGVGIFQINSDWEVIRSANVVLLSPSYLVVHQHRGLVFAVGETSPGVISSFTVTDDGLHYLGSGASGGDGGCHLAIDHTGRYVVVAHYNSGSVSSLRIEDDGRLSAPLSVLDFDGSGPDQYRQSSAHPHQIAVVGEELLVPDLGADLVRRLHLDSHGQLEEIESPVVLPPGSGPRHILAFRNHLVVVCELTAQLWAGSLIGGIGHGRIVSSSRRTPAPGGRVYPSAIAIVEDRVIVANRGVDTIAVFSHDPELGTVDLIAEVSAKVACPRDLTVRAGQIWVAGQVSGTISIFDVVESPPFVRRCATLRAPSPSCILLL